jgi:hypothetical protein
MKVRKLTSIPQHTLIIHLCMLLAEYWDNTTLFPSVQLYISCSRKGTHTINSASNVTKSLKLRTSSHSRIQYIHILPYSFFRHILTSQVIMMSIDITLVMMSIDVTQVYNYSVVDIVTCSCSATNNCGFWIAYIDLLDHPFDTCNYIELSPIQDCHSTQPIITLSIPCNALLTWLFSDTLLTH